MKCTTQFYKEGVHLAPTISLLDTILQNPVQRIGISATMELSETEGIPVASDDRETRNSGQPVKNSEDKWSKENYDLDILLCSPKFSELSVMKVLKQC